MKRIITIIIFVLSLNSAFAQTYTLTSNSFVTIKDPYERKEYNQRSIIVVDMNKLTIEIYRGNNHYYLKILEQKSAHESFASALILIQEYITYGNNNFMNKDTQRRYT